MNGVSIINGGRHADARGVLRFCNDFDMREVKRFYTVSNSADHPQRGWIMHKRETKWFFPVTGVTEVKVRGEGEQWNDIRSYVLDAAKPTILQVPPGHWFLIDQSPAIAPPDPLAIQPTLSQPAPLAEVQVFSNCKVGEFQNDDFRRS